MAQLALQRLGIGRDPDRAAAVLGPQRGRSEIAQGFAGAGPGLRQQQVRRAFAAARREDLRRLDRVAALRRAALGSIAGQRGEPADHGVRSERHLTRLWPFRRLVPLGQTGE